MKIVQLKKQYFFIVILMFVFSVAHSQVVSSNGEGSIYPSAIIQIKKTEPNMMKNLLQLSGKDKNELTDKYRNKNPGAANNLLSAQYNSLSNSISLERKKPNVCPPLVQTNFEGNPLTPFYLPPVGYYASECNIAISNAGKIVSISNGWINYYNKKGILVFSDSLYHFCSGLIDVRLLYDPKKGRFVFISGYGFTDFVGTFQGIGVVVAFSKTNDPLDGWNFYYLPDSSFKDNSSGDYPLLGINDDEIFISEGRINPEGNSTHSSIVQINKNDGYAGLATIHTQIFNVQLPGGLIYGNLTPAPGGSSTYGPDMYFIMENETGRPSNVYRVYEITNTIASGQAALKMYGPVSSNIAFAPKQNAYQPGGIPLNSDLADEDDFVQNAFFENGVLQFCQHTNVNGKAAVYLGRIRGIPNNLTCTAKTISDPNLYLSYPSIAYAGNSSSDNSAIVGIEHTGANRYPGLSAVYVSSNFKVSALTTVKAGNDTINALWGDYSGICRRYNHPGECWMEGQYGSQVFKNINWIAKLKAPSCAGEVSSVNSITELSSKTIGSPYSLSNYPNPFSNSTTLSFSVPVKQKVSIKIYDVNGRLIKTLVDGEMQPGSHQLKWNAKDGKGIAIAAGIYFLKMQSVNYSETKKLVVIK